MTERRTPGLLDTSYVPDVGVLTFPIPVVGLAWQARAACTRAVAAGEVTADTWDDHVDGERRSDRLLRHELAAAYCARCPVAAACDTDRVNGHGGGFRAGAAYDDASDHRHETHTPPAAIPAPRAAAACGSPRGARAHRYRGENVCPPCADAERTENAERMRRARAAKAELAAERAALEVPA